MRPEPSVQPPELWVLHHLVKEALPVRAGWIHLPALPNVAARVENLGMPSMSVETSVAGKLVALGAISKHHRDIDDTLPSNSDLALPLNWPRRSKAGHLILMSLRHVSFV